MSVAVIHLQDPLLSFELPLVTTHVLVWSCVCVLRVMAVDCVCFMFVSRFSSQLERVETHCWKAVGH